MRFLNSSTVVGLSVIGLIFTGASAMAEPTEMARSTVEVTKSVAPLDCGFWENHATAFYTHCANNCIWIIVDYASGPNQYKQIRQGGTYDIGGARDVDNAWYSHVC